MFASKSFVFESSHRLSYVCLAGKGSNKWYSRGFFFTRITKLGVANAYCSIIRILVCDYFCFLWFSSFITPSLSKPPQSRLLFIYRSKQKLSIPLSNKACCKHHHSSLRSSLKSTTTNFLVFDSCEQRIVSGSAGAKIFQVDSRAVSLPCLEGVPCDPSQGWVLVP